MGKRNDRKGKSLHEQYGFRNVAVRIEDNELAEIKYRAKVEFDMNLADFVRYAIDRTLEAKANVS